MTYVYQCRRCGERFEARQRITDPPLRYHYNGQPISAAATVGFCTGDLYRVPQALHVVYRGKGFHTTDYRQAGSSDDE